MIDFKDRKYVSFSNRKRTVLVVDDELINRELLGAVLAEKYETVFAEDGEQAMEILRSRGGAISLVLLDVLMPKMNGFEVLEAIGADDALKHIPVIVLTTEKEYEIKCLQLGASDFIAKPFDLPDVILARIARTIELFESTQIIETTGFDKLTGLFTQEYFFQIAEQYDSFNKDAMMDAVWVDVVHFHLMNEIYGHEIGNDILKQLAINGRDLENTGIPKGEALGRTLAYLLDEVHKSPELNDREKLLQMAETFIKK